MKNPIRRAARWARRRRRRLRFVLLLTVLLVLGAHPGALAADVFNNIDPAPQLPPGGWVGRYPVGNYSLDQYFPAISVGFTSGVDASGVVPMIAFFGAQVLWEITLFLANGVILLFALAFNLDLVNGNGTPGSGALAPVSQAIHNLYTSTFGTPWLIAAVTLVGCWAMWKALIQRHYTQTATALAVSVLFFIVAIGIVTQPEQTIAPASKLSNQLSTALLSLSSDGSVGDESHAKTAASNQLFELLVLDPWTVLEFGGVEHCATVSHGKAQSVPVRPLSSSPASDAKLAVQLEHGTELTTNGKTCINDRNKYATHFLQFPFQSHRRNAEHVALEHGDDEDLPSSDSGKTDGTYPLGPADKPAAEAMGKGGQLQRLLLAIVILLGEIGAYLLLGALAIGVIIAQILLLTQLAFSPVALLIGIFPGRGHDFFKKWLSKLASYLARKVLYSLILAIVLAVCSALDDATSNLGWLLAFAVQAAFLWTVFLQRNRLANDLMAGTLGPHAARESTNRLQALYYSTRLARMFTANSAGNGRAAENSSPSHPASLDAGAPPPDEDGAGGGASSGDGSPPSAGGARPGPNETPTHGPGAPSSEAAHPAERSNEGDEQPPVETAASQAGTPRGGQQLGTSRISTTPASPSRASGPPRLRPRPPVGQEPPSTAPHPSVEAAPPAAAPEPNRTPAGTPETRSTAPTRAPATAIEQPTELPHRQRYGASSADPATQEDTSE